MKLSKIVLISFFSVCLMVSLFYTSMILGADNQASKTTDYEAINFNRNIKTIIVEDGWTLSAYVGKDAYLKSGRYFEFDFRSDATEKEQLLEMGENGLILYRYIAQFDEELLAQVELNGDTLIFKELSPELSSILGARRIRVNLTNIENVQMTGKSRLMLAGSQVQGSINLPKLNLDLDDQAFISLRQFLFNELNIIGKSRARFDWSFVTGRVFNLNGNLVYEEYDGDQSIIDSSISLSGMASMSMFTKDVEFDNISLKDESYIIFYKQDMLMTELGTITKR